MAFLPGFIRFIFKGKYPRTTICVGGILQTILFHLLNNSSSNRFG